MKNARLNLRISSEDLEKIRQKAKHANKTLTDDVTAVCHGKETTVIPGLPRSVETAEGLG